MNAEPLRFQDLGHYEKSIVTDTNCAPEDAGKVECVMRDFILHSTLDHLSRPQFRRAAREAYALLQSERAEFDGYFDGMRCVFEKGRAADALHEEKAA